MRILKWFTIEAYPTTEENSGVIIRIRTKGGTSWHGYSTFNQALEWLLKNGYLE